MAMCHFRVGDGACTSFWQDIWLTESALAISFHSVFALNNHRLESVRDRISLGWGPDNLRRLPRGGIEHT